MQHQMEAISRLTTAIRLVPVTGELVAQYCRIGRSAYGDHYLHLWKQRDPLPYFEEHLDPGIVSGLLADKNLAHYLVFFELKAIGILKLVLNAPLGKYNASEALLLEKIYLLAPFTGKGLGSALMLRLIEIARGLGKRVLWLDTMQKGPALHFYLKSGFHIEGTTTLNLPGVIPSESPMYILLKEVG